LMRIIITDRGIYEMTSGMCVYLLVLCGFRFIRVAKIETLTIKLIDFEDGLHEMHELVNNNS